MPNHITNKLIITGAADRVAACRKVIRGKPQDDGSIPQICFQTIIPMPESLRVVDTSHPTPEQQAIYEANLKHYGHATWYGWCRANWGTKWDAYETPNEKDTADAIYFETAWSHPTAVLSELSRQWPDLTFECWYADEDTGYNFGHTIYHDGQRTTDQGIVEGTPDATRFSLELRYGRPLTADELEERGLNARYEWIDD